MRTKLKILALLITPFGFAEGGVVPENCTVTDIKAGTVAVAGQLPGYAAASTDDPVRQKQIMRRGNELSGFATRAATRFLACEGQAPAPAFLTMARSVGDDSAASASAAVPFVVSNDTDSAITVPVSVVIFPGQIGVFPVDAESCDLGKVVGCEPSGALLSDVLAGPASASVRYRVLAGNEEIFSLDLSTDISHQNNLIPRSSVRDGRDHLAGFRSIAAGSGADAFTWDETEISVPVAVPARTNVPIRLVVDLETENDSKCNSGGDCLLAAVTFADPVGSGLSTGSTNENTQKR